MLSLLYVSCTVGSNPPWDDNLCVPQIVIQSLGVLYILSFYIPQVSRNIGSSIGGIIFLNIRTSLKEYDFFQVSNYSLEFLH